jgi:hypothetical protein
VPIHILPGKLREKVGAGEKEVGHLADPEFGS